MDHFQKQPIKVPRWGFRCDQQYILLSLFCIGLSDCLSTLFGRIFVSSAFGIGQGWESNRLAWGISYSPLQLMDLFLDPELPS